MGMSTFQRIRRAAAEKQKLKEATEILPGATIMEGGLLVEGEQGQEIPIPDLATMTVKELRAFAQQNGIDLAGAAKKEDILNKLSEKAAPEEITRPVDEKAAEEAAPPAVGEVVEPVQEEGAAAHGAGATETGLL